MIRAEPIIPALGMCLCGPLVLLSIVLVSRIEVRAEDVMSRIKWDERVVFFPTAAWLTEDRQSWIVPIHGWIYEPERDDALRGTAVERFCTLLGMDQNEPSTQYFEQRARLFLVDNERGKRIGVRIAGQQHTLDVSGADGHFFGTIQLPVETVDRLLSDRRLVYDAITGPGDVRTFQGQSYCVAAEGISVISDVDDTIKVTDVLDKGELIRNTFFREFRAVDGMSTVYADWAKSGAQFHYVSASPWQLYEPLAELLRTAGFPGGTFHLKRFRVKDSSFLELFTDPIAYKISAIEPLLQQYSQRRFVLVGDSGEKDPEVYGILARRYPAQVVRVCIRDITNEPADGDRYRDAFRDVSPDVWQLYREPSGLRGYNAP